MIESEPIEITVVMRLHVRDQETKWVWSNVSGLTPVRSPDASNPNLAQEYLEEMGLNTLYKILRDFGEYQNWGGEWKPASAIFRRPDNEQRDTSTNI